MIPSKLKPHPIPDAALDADIAILGKKGRGKTFTAKGIVERLLQMQRRVLVLDPLSVWWGLKSGADGKSPGKSILSLWPAHRPGSQLLPASIRRQTKPVLPFRFLTNLSGGICGARVRPPSEAILIWNEWLGKQDRNFLKQLP